MAGLASLAGTSTLMFLGSYLAGLLPLAVGSTSAASLRIINALGAGLLLGAALCVVLPEGFVTFIEAQEKLDAASRYPEWLLGLSLLLGFLAMVGLQAASEQWEGHESKGSVQDPSLHPPEAAAASRPNGNTVQKADGLPEEQALLLELGLGLGPAGSRSSSAEALGALEMAGSPYLAAASLSAADQALYGLVIHSAADGIAVGAACLSNSVALTTSVGAAILIHKFPVAFGLSSFLRGAGWQGPRLQKGLLLFCSAAPLAAIAMYVLLGRVVIMTDERSVALCLLFSGGTVLHAGLVHVLPSVLGSSSEAHRSHMHGDGDGHSRLHARAKPAVLAVLVGASLVPLVISALLPET